MPGVSKVEYFGETLIDLTNDTVTEDTLDEGVTAHNAQGEPITGKRAVMDPNDYVPKSGATMTGALVAQNNTDYTIKQVRNAVISTSESGLSGLSNGDFVFIREV